ncbi:hypothetical protein DFH06DRAFT_1324161 [Mycena polygramma]|nr:hypothetical protein DFH06DRAFT_1324161 [Mycena polygramma]
MIVSVFKVGDHVNLRTDLPVFPYPAAVKIGPSGVPEATSSSFPAINAQNQRTCRQCGVPRRYKEGKCVEKWGPGPLGPGTVCDRCRKKMKRVERRGTLEQQQSQPASGAATPASATSASFQARSMHPTNMLTAPAVNSAYSNTRSEGAPLKSGMHSSLAMGASFKTASRPPEEEGDSLDADAEAEVDEIEEEFVQAVHHGNPHDAEGGEDGEADRDGEGDPEADLLEAVEAAEKGSAN